MFIGIGNDIKGSICMVAFGDACGKGHLLEHVETKCENERKLEKLT